MGSLGGPCNPISQSRRLPSLEREPVRPPSPGCTQLLCSRAETRGPGAPGAGEGRGDRGGPRWTETDSPLRDKPLLRPRLQRAEAPRSWTPLPRIPERQRAPGLHVPECLRRILPGAASGQWLSIHPHCLSVLLPLFKTQRDGTVRFYRPSHLEGERSQTRTMNTKVKN